MKITVFNGSPRGRSGNTHFMVREFISGAEESGAEAENIFLAEKRIKPCRGCFKCWVHTPGKCVIKDDMKELLPLFFISDVVVYATPLYVDNVTGIMKNFMDRLIPRSLPHFNKDQGGECRHFPRFEKKPKLAVISNCGFPEQSHFQVLKLLFRRIARNMNTELVAEIYRGGGELLSHSPEPLKDVIDSYKGLLRQAGKEVAAGLRLSPQTMAALEEPLIPDHMYIEGANKSWDRQLGEK